MAMTKMKLGTRALLALLALSATAAGAAPPIALEPLVTGLDRPVGLVEANDGSGRLFIFTLPGQIWIWDGEKLLDRPFLNLGDGVNCCSGERGLGGLAFHPDFADNGFFYVAYDGPNETSRVSRFRVSGNASLANRGSERVLLRVPQPSPGTTSASWLSARTAFSTSPRATAARVAIR